MIIDTPDFYSKSRRSVYELEFMNEKPKLLDYHRLRASMYKWLSNAEHSYLLYCSPKGFNELEVDDNFNDDGLKPLMDDWKPPIGIGA